MNESTHGLIFYLCVICYAQHGIKTFKYKSNLDFIMVVTCLQLELHYQSKNLRGVHWKLTRSEHGFLLESSWLFALQVLVPYLVSGLGMVSAGIVMDLIQVFKYKL